MATQTVELTADEIRQFAQQGYLIRRGQLTGSEVGGLLEHYAAIHAAGSRPSCFELRDGDDPLAAWPRMMHPHRFDDRSRRYLLDARLMGVVEALYGRPALAAQTMFYWKPPGARGQALHQDDFYLRTRVGECLAAWLSLDRADDENGGLRVVPGSHRGELQCPKPADESVSFAQHEVTPLPGAVAVPTDLGAGDILFFGGRLIHGSPPNRSPDRWRRALICHYVPCDAVACSHHYQPLLDRSGGEHRIDDPGPESDPCGGPEYR